MEHSKNIITVESNPHCAKARYPGICRDCDGKSRNKKCYVDHCLVRYSDSGEWHSFFDFTLPPCLDGTYPLVQWKVEKENKDEKESEKEDKRQLD